MKISKLGRAAFTAGLVLLFAGAVQSADDTAAATLDSDAEKASYGIGYVYMRNLKAQTEGVRLSKGAIIQGIADAFSGVDQRVPQEGVQAAIAVLQAQMMAQAKAREEWARSDARALGEAFLASNAGQPGVVTTASGLQYKVLVRGGNNQHPTANSTLKVHYHGTLIDGTVFDSSVKRGEPVEFPLNGVIPGWTEGVQLMSSAMRVPLWHTGPRQGSAVS